MRLLSKGAHYYLGFLLPTHTYYLIKRHCGQGSILFNEVRYSKLITSLSNYNQLTKWLPMVDFDRPSGSSRLEVGKAFKMGLIISTLRHTLKMI